MRINKSDKIGGQPILQVRNFLRKHEQFDVETIGMHFELNTEATEQLIKGLSECGYLQLNKKLTKRNGKRVWETTQLGIRLSAASAMAPILREKAERLVSELLDRVKHVREDDGYLWEVETLVVFGSYTTDSEDLGDIDLTLTLRHKEKFQEDWLERTLEQADKSGKTMSSYSDRLGFSEKKVRQFLKSRSPYLRFHRPGEPEELDAVFRIIYQAGTEQQR